MRSQQSEENRMTWPGEECLEIYKAVNHNLDDDRIRRPFMDPHKWEEVKRSITDPEGKTQEDYIIDKIWEYVTRYNIGEKKREVLVDFPYFKKTFKQMRLRKELHGSGQISNRIMDLYALRLMRRLWKSRDNIQHCPVYIMPIEFAEDVVDHVDREISTPFEAVEHHFELKGGNGTSIFKLADRVFIPVLSKVNGALHWWCVCINFVQHHVDVLVSNNDALADTEREQCIQEFIKCIVEACNLLRPEKFAMESPGGINTHRQQQKSSCGVNVMKWFEDWNGTGEDPMYDAETTDDFKRWMIADWIVDGENKCHSKVLPQIGFQIPSGE